MKPLKSRLRKKIGANNLYLKAGGGLKRFTITSLPYILSLTAVGVLLGGVVAYALNSPTFRLTEVKILNSGLLSQEQAFRFCELRRDENLVTLDLVNVQQVIKRKHPEFKEVLVRRVLPNRIEVTLKRRTPVAQVAFSRYLQVDKDLILLPGSSPVPFRNLTIIQGAPAPPGGLSVGSALRDSNTVKAMKMAEIVKRSNILKKHTLTKVDISDRKNIVLVVDGLIEIRMGDGHFIDRLKILDQTLKTIELDPSAIHYIDLRFDDVIVGSK